MDEQKAVPWIRHWSQRADKWCRCQASMWKCVVKIWNNLCSCVGQRERKDETDEGHLPAAAASATAAVSPEEPGAAALQTPWHVTATAGPPEQQSSELWMLRPPFPRRRC